MLWLQLQIDEMDLEEEERDLINREINKFRDAHKVISFAAACQFHVLMILVIFVDNNLGSMALWQILQLMFYFSINFMMMCLLYWGDINITQRPCHWFLAKNK